MLRNIATIALSMCAAYGFALIYYLLAVIIANSDIRIQDLW